MWFGAVGQCLQVLCYHMCERVVAAREGFDSVLYMLSLTDMNFQSDPCTQEYLQYSESNSGNYMAEDAQMRPHGMRNNRGRKMSGEDGCGRQGRGKGNGA